MHGAPDPVESSSRWVVVAGSPIVATVHAVAPIGKEIVAKSLLIGWRW